MNAETGNQKGVVAVVPRDGRLLVIRRSKFVVAPRAYCFPGGAIRSGENQRAAIVREMYEELSVHVAGIERLWTSVTPWHVALAWWLVEIQPGQVIQPNPQEVEAFAWLTPAEMRELPELLVSNRHFLNAWDKDEFSLRL